MPEDRTPERADRDGRPTFVEGSAQGVRNTVQLYVPTDVSGREAWRIDAGEDYRGLVYPSGCVLLWPAGDAPDLPLTIPAPPPERIPWPLSSMGAPPPEWARLDDATSRAIADARASTRPDAHPSRTND